MAAVAQSRPHRARGHRHAAGGLPPRPAQTRSAGRALCVDLFFNDPATAELYTLSLHDALPIWRGGATPIVALTLNPDDLREFIVEAEEDRKSTRLNSSHSSISYAVFCLKKKTPATATTAVMLWPHGCSRSKPTSSRAWPPARGRWTSAAPCANSERRTRTLCGSFF